MVMVIDQGCRARLWRMAGSIATRGCRAGLWTIAAATLFVLVHLAVGFRP